MKTKALILSVLLLASACFAGETTATLSSDHVKALPTVPTLEGLRAEYQQTSQQILALQSQLLRLEGAISILELQAQDHGTSTPIHNR